MPSVAEIGGATLRDYGGSGPPVVFIPSLINPPNVLDLAPGNSLLRWLSERGHRPLLLDWGWPGGDRRALSVAGHVEEVALPLIAQLAEPPALVGYCLGGTMAIAAARLTPVSGVAAIAAPWHFAGFPEEARAMLVRLWQASDATVAAHGVLPMELLQSAFWSLDPARTVSKFERLPSLEEDQARSFVRLEDWANDGPPMVEAAARELFEDFFARDLTGSGEWLVAGKKVDPSTLPCSFLNIVSTVDRIVPHSSAAVAGERLELELGHVGMIVGSRARPRLWEPLSGWLSRLASSC